MKMPATIQPNLLAPCFMTCLVCYKYCNTKNPCTGCLSEGSAKPPHCRVCKIKQCATQKKLSYCFLCDAYPCRLLQALEKSYKKRYCTSLIKNGIYAKEHGIEAFLLRQRRKWSCPRCGGVISLHDRQCSECGAFADTTDT